MRSTIWGIVVVLGAASVIAAGQPRQSSEPPSWAYAIPAPAPAGATPAAPDTSQKQVPGSPLSFTRQQISDGFGPADWFPADHPAMPDVVAHGKRPDARACGLCHYPNGKGRQENAGVSGLPWTPWVRVVETSTVPKMESRGGIWIPLEGGAKEPIGMRIMETPENPERTEILRDPRSGFIAYVPPGSLKKGEALVKTGGSGRTEACGVCHGRDLMGLGPVPGIAGRSPSYLTRQMYDMQAGVRQGEWTNLMKPVVERLTEEDLVDISAYVASMARP
jgi:cytochrome c553